MQNRDFRYSVASFRGVVPVARAAPVGKLLPASPRATAGPEDAAERQENLAGKAAPRVFLRMQGATEEPDLLDMPAQWCCPVTRVISSFTGE